MSAFYIGAEVGEAADHDTRGVIVDSAPDRGWLVWWCYAETAVWHVAAKLWLRDCEPGHNPTRDRVLHFDARNTRLAYRALSRLVRSWDGHEERTDDEDAIAALCQWLGQSRSGQGLTSERDADYLARGEIGVRVTVDSCGALVIRVPRKSREPCPPGEIDEP